MSEELTLAGVLERRRGAGGEIVNVDEPTRKMVIFAVGEEWFACAGENVREILPHGGIHFVPGCPPSLEGVINVRGDIESVIHLGMVLGAVGGGSGGSILLAQGGGMRSGLRVDRVVDVLDVPQSQVQPPLGTVQERLRPLVCGLMRHQGRSVTVLDLDRLLQEYRKGLG